MDDVRIAFDEALPISAAVEEIRDLIASCMNVAPEEVPPETAEKVAADCAGNPFFAAEMVRASGEQGLLRADAAALSVVPETVVRALNRRTDLLGEESRAVLTVAAAIGQRFCLPVVQLAAGEDESAVDGRADDIDEVA